MKSLIDKVQKIEADAKKRIEATERDGLARLSTLRTGENSVIKDIKDNAEQRAISLINEKKKVANSEINQMKQDREKAVANVSIEADKRRSDAVERVVALFEESYLN